MQSWWLVGVGLVASLGCSSKTANPLTCGAGTRRVGNECLPLDAGPADAHVDARADAPPDAAPIGSSSTTIGLGPLQDGLQPLDTVRSPLAPVWTQSFGGNVTYPVVANEVVYVSVAMPGASSVSALDIHNGTTRWGPISVGPRALLTYDDGRLFTLTNDGRLSAYDAATGLLVWSVQLQDQTFFNAPPVAVAGRVYVAAQGSGGTVYALDGSNGNLLWTYPDEGSDGTVAVAGGVVYVGEPCSRFLALNATTGTRLWDRGGNCTGGGGATASVHGARIWARDPTEGGVIVDHGGTALGTFTADALPAFLGGTVFYRNGSTVTAVDIASATRRWSFTGDGFLTTAPLVAGAGGQIFVASRMGTVYELDAATGAQRSTYDVGTQIPYFMENMSWSLADDHLLLPLGSQLVVF
ncbi:MAG: PQQ-like beta-propeller repeat protein [Deltaproteobacteria bacterium]|nr:PQQ-like beta-propeller repeat protein [Deltaproteobacteria bacterium]